MQRARIGPIQQRGCRNCGSQANHGSDRRRRAPVRCSQVAPACDDAGQRAEGLRLRGTRTTASYSGRIGFSSRLIMEPGVTMNRVNLPYGDFSANLLNARVVLTPTPRMQAASLIQFNPNAHTLSASARLRWEYTPGNEIFASFGQAALIPGARFKPQISQAVIRIGHTFRF